MERNQLAPRAPGVGQLPETGYVRQSQLIPFILPFSPATLWRKVKSGDFPNPVKLSARSKCPVPPILFKHLRPR